MLIFNGAACNLGSLSPMKIQTAVYFNFMHMEGRASLSRVAGDGCAREGRRNFLDLEKCLFCPQVSGKAEQAEPRRYGPLSTQLSFN